MSIGFGFVCALALILLADVGGASKKQPAPRQRPSARPTGPPSFAAGSNGSSSTSRASMPGASSTSNRRTPSTPASTTATSAGTPKNKSKNSSGQPSASRTTSAVRRSPPAPSSLRPQASGLSSTSGKKAAVQTNQTITFYLRHNGKLSFAELPTATPYSSLTAFNRTVSAVNAQRRTAGQADLPTDPSQWEFKGRDPEEQTELDDQPTHNDPIAIFHLNYEISVSVEYKGAVEQILIGYFNNSYSSLWLFLGTMNEVKPIRPTWPTDPTKWLFKDPQHVALPLSPRENYSTEHAKDVHYVYYDDTVSVKNHPILPSVIKAYIDNKAYDIPLTFYEKSARDLLKSAIELFDIDVVSDANRKNYANWTCQQLHLSDRINLVHDETSPVNQLLLNHGMYGSDAPFYFTYHSPDDARSAAELHLISSGDVDNYRDPMWESAAITTDGESEGWTTP